MFFQMQTIEHVMDILSIQYMTDKAAKGNKRSLTTNWSWTISALYGWQVLEKEGDLWMLREGLCYSDPVGGPK